MAAAEQVIDEVSIDEVMDAVLPRSHRAFALLQYAAVPVMSEGFDFLGFHIQWRRKYGSNK